VSPGIGISWSSMSDLSFTKVENHWFKFYLPIKKIVCRETTLFPRKTTLTLFGKTIYLHRKNSSGALNLLTLHRQVPVYQKWIQTSKYNPTENNSYFQIRFPNPQDFKAIRTIFLAESTFTFIQITLPSVPARAKFYRHMAHSGREQKIHHSFINWSWRLWPVIHALLS